MGVQIHPTLTNQNWSLGALVENRKYRLDTSGEINHTSSLFPKTKHTNKNIQIGWLKSNSHPRWIRIRWIRVRIQYHTKNYALRRDHPCFAYLCLMKQICKKLRESLKFWIQSHWSRVSIQCIIQSGHFRQWKGALSTVRLGKHA